jgi:hypothetical protein
MSWGVIRQGSKEQVRKAIEDDFEGVQKNFAAGTLEGEDIALVRKQMLRTIDALDDSEHSYYGNIIRAEAHGSHAWNVDPERPAASTFTMNVSRLGKEFKGP